MFKLINEECAEMYRDWFNNFLTVSYFAEYYSITEEQATNIINLGRASHEYNVYILKMDEVWLPTKGY